MEDTIENCNSTLKVQRILNYQTDEYINTNGFKILKLAVKYKCMDLFRLESFIQINYQKVIDVFIKNYKTYQIFDCFIFSNAFETAIRENDDEYITKMFLHWKYNKYMIKHTIQLFVINTNTLFKLIETKRFPKLINIIMLISQYSLSKPEIREYIIANYKQLEIDRYYPDIINSPYIYYNTWSLNHSLLETLHTHININNDIFTNFLLNGDLNFIYDLFEYQTKKISDSKQYYYEFNKNSMQFIDKILSRKLSVDSLPILTYLLENTYFVSESQGYKSDSKRVLKLLEKYNIKRIMN
jgi:hypothetical protein